MRISPKNNLEYENKDNGYAIPDVGIPYFFSYPATGKTVLNRIIPEHKFKVITMPNRKNSIPELSNPNYVPIIKNSATSYGGSQMWFPADRIFSKDYILHNYGCGTIATADLLLYLALYNSSFRSLETEIAFRGSSSIYHENYEAYIHTINRQYTKTKRFLAVFGTRIASVINDYSDSYGFGYHASWKTRLTYFDMLEMMEEMLYQDIPVILSIGPNTPKLWGRKGISFYTIREIEYPVDESNSPPDIPSVPDKPESSKKPYYYKTAATDVRGHYVTVTGVIKDDVAYRIMLRISSWGKQYYINYEEYRDYIDSYGDTYTSGMVRVILK